jgi:hypothetical protein
MGKASKYRKASADAAGKRGKRRFGQLLKKIVCLSILMTKY